MSTGVSSARSFRSKLSKYFGAHGRFCASHPWEVIVSIVTLTVCALSMSILSGGKVTTLCGYSKPCQPKPIDEERSDTVMLSIVNCLAVIYIYKQFSSLRKAGSKYLLAIAGLFTIFSSFVFGSTVVNIIDSRVAGLSEALPFFLLLIDLSKATALARLAFKSRTKEEVRENIGLGVASLGPTMTLDTLVEVLLISIGTISGVPRLETVCCFGCMSIVASYLVFMTFFPASLALFLEVCPYDPSNSGWHLDNLARDMHKEEAAKKPNPVAQRVKIIMALGLFVVHFHSRFLSSMTGLSFGFTWSSDKSATEGSKGDKDMEVVPLPDYLWWKVFNLSLDQLIAVILSLLLFIKYIFFDKTETFSTSRPASPVLSHHNGKAPLPGTTSSSSNTNSTVVSANTCPFALPNTRDSSHAMAPSFSSFSAAVRGQRAPTGLEKMMKEPIVIESGSSSSGGGRTRPALPPANSGAKKLSMEGTGGGGETSMESGETPAGGGISRNKSGSQLGNNAEVKSKIESISHSHAKGPLETDARATSVEAQSNIERPGVDSPLFSIGGSDRKSSVSDSESSVDSYQHADSSASSRPLDMCLAIWKSDGGASLLTDEEVIKLVDTKHIPAYKLESALGDCERGVSIRRQMLCRQLSNKEDFASLPFTNYPHYSIVNGACCENVIGYMPIPVGYAGPLLLDGLSYNVPMSTTEGALVASTNRGCRALASAGGVHSSIVDDGMTRGPVVRFPSATEASRFKLWLDEPDNFQLVEESFNSTSQFAKLKSLKVAVAGRLLYIRFKASTGDAMGMNMLSKGVEKALEFIKEKFPALEVISLSGNFCTDKKPAAINWIEGRGKSVVCEATIPAQVVSKVLKTSVEALVELNISKNLVGSAMAGSIGGFNAHAANIVTAIFIATGQDPAQNITSSNCMTLMEKAGPKGEDLYISCTMPSIEIGTVGGGTVLPPQAACLAMLGVRGSNNENPGGNASRLARVVCATVLAGELSLLSALAAGHLVKSHLTHNRSQLNLSSISEGTEPREHRRTHSATGIPPGISPPPSASHRRRASYAPGT